MAKVMTHMCMSLDGFVAQPDDNPAELFDWYWCGDVVVPSAQDEMSFSVDAASAPMLQELTSACGALIAGRRLFDLTGGWADNHPAGGRRPAAVSMRRRSTTIWVSMSLPRGRRRVWVSPPSVTLRSPPSSRTVPTASSS